MYINLEVTVPYRIIEFFCHHNLIERSKRTGPTGEFWGMYLFLGQPYKQNPEKHPKDPSRALKAVMADAVEWAR